ncbi:MAG: hypothetical protein RI904_2200, partial [Pseudomonadota bacterium]
MTHPALEVTIRRSDRRLAFGKHSHV